MKTGGVIFRFILGLLLACGGLLLWALLVYFLGSRSIPLVRAAEGLGNNFPRGIGLVAFCPITVPVLLYALFSSRSR